MMPKRLFTSMSLILLTLIAAIPAFAQTEAVKQGNVTEGCVTAYDPAVDYFPDKAEVVDASGFTVDYHGHYKVVSVTNAFRDAPLFEYVLVQCGTPKPDDADFPDGTPFIDVPVGRVITMSTTEIPHLAELGLLSHLVGLDSFDYVGNADVRALIDAQKLVEIGHGTTVNVEAALDARPDLILTYGYDPATDSYPVLAQTGIVTALASEYREATPLGRAEWIKFTAAFFNAEARANEVYGEISSGYQQARALAASVPADQRPTVLWNTFSAYSKAWNIPGPQSYIGAFIQDAGGTIALGDLASQGSAPLSFEVVLDGALDADVWITGTAGIRTKADLVTLDSRYADFAAFRNNHVWNNDLSLNANGGNAYWEVGVTHPNLILQDLVAIFHPELMPGHPFAFFRSLGDA